MSAFTIDPAITRLSNPALISDATAKMQIFDFVPAPSFQIEIALEDSSAVNPVLDLTSAIVNWQFTPVDPDDYADDEVYTDEVTDEGAVLDGDEDSDLEEALDSEDDDDEEDVASDLLGFLDLTFQVSRDTLIQAALLRESACINVSIVIRDKADVPLANHKFMGFIYQEDLLPLGGSYLSPAGTPMTCSVRIRVFDCTLWSML